MSEAALKTLFSLFILLGFLGVFVWANSHMAFAQDQSGSEKPAVKVLAQPVQFTENNNVFEAVGTGRAKLSADIYPSVSEEVVEVNFSAQQKVAKGDVLVQLDDRNEKLALQLAEVELKDAKSLSSRYENAVKEGAVPQSEVDSARATYDAALVAVEQAKLNLGERKIIAPFDGVVGIPNVDPGDRVDSSTLITGLDARDVLYLDFEVPEALAAELRKAENQKQKVTAITPSYPDRKFEGLITALESRVNPQTRTMIARATIQNEEDMLRPGMSFMVRWNIEGDEFPTVPEISLQWGRDGSYVWLVRDGKAERVMARVVARKAGQVLLDGEIKEGALVVVEGLQRMRPGASVELINNAGETSEQEPSQ